MSFQLDLPAGLWRLDIRHPILFVESPVVEITRGSERKPLELEAERGSRLLFRLKPERASPSETLPRELRVSAASSPAGLIRPADQARKESFCPLTQETPLACAVPAGELDIRVELDGFVPHYLWNFRIVPGEEHDLGDLRLKRGSSMVGWVIRPSTPVVTMEEVEVLLEPVLGDGRRDPRPDAPGAQRDQLRSRSTRPNQDGFFRWQGLEPGTYRLVATGPGLAETSYAPIRILKELETKLSKPIELQATSSLTVYLNPPVHPSGEAWRILLQAERDQAVSEAPEWVDYSGVWTRDGLDPGNYRLFISEETRRGSQRWASEEIKIEGDVLHEIELPIVEIEGTLKSAGRAQEGVVWFGGRFGSESIRMEADEGEGFRGFLPRDGEWEVDVELDRNAFQSLEPITLQRPADDGAIEVHLALPLTNIPGRVVDTFGRPITQAVVLAIRRDSEELVGQAKVSSRGEFELKAIKPGKLWLTVTTPFGEAQPLRLDLREGWNTQIAELVVEPVIQREVKILSDSGPVHGATILYRSAGVGPRLEKSVHSRPNGIAVLEMPESASGIEYQVLPGSLAMKAGTLSFEIADDSGVPEISLNPYGALLELDAGDRGVQHMALYKDGSRMVSLSAVVHWARVTTGQPLVLHRPGAFTIPKADWGFYVLCPGGGLEEEDRDSLRRLAIPKDCQGGQLSPGGVLSLAFEKDS